MPYGGWNKHKAFFIYHFYDPSLFIDIYSPILINILKYKWYIITNYHFLGNSKANILDIHLLKVIYIFKNLM